jgi:uncharacterized protein (TIGR04255 family)
MYNLESQSLRRPTLDFKTLSKAPIKESLIAMRVESAAGSVLGPLQRALQALSDDYNTPREPITLSQTQLSLGPGAGTSANVEHKQLGWRFGTKSGKYAVQARTDWFIFSHLAPYSAWPEFSAEAQRIWRVLADTYKPEAVRSVSVRNINEVSLTPGENVEKYLKFYINVPQGVPQQFQNYFARIELLQSKDTVAIIQSALLLPTSPDRARLLLDIEIVRTIAPHDERELWAAIDSLREPKNQLFFSCITEEWEAKLR